MSESNNRLDELYRQAAEMCIEEGVVLCDRPDGPVHRWVKRNVKHRPDTAFFIVLGVCHEMHKLTQQEKEPAYMKGQQTFYFNDEVEHQRKQLARIKSQWR